MYICIKGAQTPKQHSNNMKYLIAFTLLCLSFAASAQDIKYQLANASKKKWIGANTYGRNNQENTTTLTFFKNMTLVEGDRRYNSSKPPVKWWLVSGDYMKDNNIVVLIGKHQYAVEFSKTNNGKDFMSLTRIAEHEGEEQVMKTYYAE